MTLRPTPSQTVGPFYSIGLCRRAENELVPATDPAAIRVTGRLLDGDAQPIGDGMIEAWDATGARWGRCGTDPEGAVLVRDREAGCSGAGRAASRFYVFARGLLKHQLTRMYFPDEQAANAADPVLSSLPEADRASLVAEQEDGAVRFDIQMQGERQTVFFSLVSPFSAIFVPDELADAVSDPAWLDAMLAAERALARAEFRAGVITEAAAEAVAQACDASLYDCAALAVEGRASGNPAEPLVRALRARVGEQHADAVHRGATSQDIVDSAAMLVAQRASRLSTSTSPAPRTNARASPLNIGTR